MKKLESSFKNMAIVLTLISVMAGGVLAWVNQVTAGPIAQIKEENLAKAIKAVLRADDVTVSRVDTIDGGSVAYVTDKGMAIQTASTGFGGQLQILVGFDGQGSIKGYSVLEHAETPGLGAKAGTWFQEGSRGNIIGRNPGQAPLTVSKDGGDVDAITASTITSRAFLKAVNQAYELYKNNVEQ